MSSWRVECQAGELSVNTQSINIFVCLQHGDIRQLSVNSDIRDLPFHHLTQSTIVSTFALCNKLSDLKNISTMSVICQEKTALSLSIVVVFVTTAMFVFCLCTLHCIISNCKYSCACFIKKKFLLPVSM